MNLITKFTFRLGEPKSGEAIVSSDNICILLGYLGHRCRYNQWSTLYSLKTHVQAFPSTDA